MAVKKSRNYDFATLSWDGVQTKRGQAEVRGATSARQCSCANAVRVWVYCKVAFWRRLAGGQLFRKIQQKGAVRFHHLIHQAFEPE